METRLAHGPEVDSGQSSFGGIESAEQQRPHLLEIDELFKSLGTGEDGLSSDEAEKRLSEFGPNEISEKRKKNLLLIFLSNFVQLLAILMWIAGIMSLIAGMPELAYAIFGVIIVNAIFSFWQEMKAEKATEALRALLPSYQKVVRDGAVKQIYARDVVPGDILTFEEGDNISADCRVFEEYEMKTNNSTLTGESVPVKKTTAVSADEDQPLTEADNLAFAGTSVAAGSGKAVAFATGMKTQFGRIALLTQTVGDELSPLQKDIHKLTELIVLLAGVMGIILFVIARFVAGLSLVEAFLFAIGIIVANVPEGLLPTVTLSLAMAVQRMVRRHALMKKLAAVETLGSTTVICSDKTGTLTQNEMTVREIFAADLSADVTGTGYDPKGSFVTDSRELSKDELEGHRLLFRAAMLCNTSKLIPPESGGSWTILGDPTEGALLVAAVKAGLDRDSLLREQPRIWQIPFESVRKRMSTVHKTATGSAAYIKGAPKETVALCDRLLDGGQIRPMTDDDRSRILQANDDMSTKALRVIAFAYKELPGQKSRYEVDEVESGMIFVGLMGMMDPPRDEVSKAVETCHRAGIRIIMITGDYGITALAIARKIGIVTGNAPRIVTGQELEKLAEGELKEILSKEEVIFARVAPEHKMKVVGALKELGQTVAVTGDGVNDAPALKRADIGIAMGITGTDVAKEAANMVLTDDNFASIVSAIEEGRAVFDNIRKFIVYIFAHLTPEIIPFVLFALFNIPLPITVLQMLAIDLGTETLPALALGVETPEPGVMDRPPRPRNRGLVDKALLFRGYLYLGIISAVASLSGYFWVLYKGGWTWGARLSQTSPLYLEATTTVFLGIVVLQIGNAFAVRSETESTFKFPLFSNKLLIGGIVFELLFTFALIYTPFLQRIFGTTALPPANWLFMLAFVPVVLLADELRKYSIRRGLRLREVS